MRRSAAILLAAALSSGAAAAELPSRAQKHPANEPKLRACEIGGAPGVELPSGGCVRVSGYVSSGVSVGNVKHQ